MYLCSIHSRSDYPHSGLSYIHILHISPYALSQVQGKCKTLERHAKATVVTEKNTASTTDVYGGINTLLLI